MKKYDAIIVGAGPSGGECARQLSSQGFQTLLTDKIPNFSTNSYSSAGAPNEILKDFDLPQEVVAAKWDTFKVYSSKNKIILSDSQPRGVVMNFTKLREFLARATEKNGGSVELGYQYTDHEIHNEGVIVAFKTRSNEKKQLMTKVLIDATGGERHVLAKTQNKNSFQSTGIEYLVEVPENVYDQWADSLSFFMGHKWMPQGYSWIFPMEPNKLKVGIGRYFQQENFVPHNKSYSCYLNHMMSECLGSEHLPILDRHGKTINYTFHPCDLHAKGPVLAIGDAVSTINPLAFEGIRHAMASSRIAVSHLIKKINDPAYSLSGYKKELKKYYGYKWLICERLMKMIYCTPKDETVEDLLSAFQHFTFDDLYNFGFYYKSRCALKFLWNFQKAKIKRSLGSLQKNR